MDNLPQGKTIWLLFDLDNGHEPGKHYTWWFNKYSQAKRFKDEHSRSDQAELVGPIKATLSKTQPRTYTGTRLSLKNR